MGEAKRRLSRVIREKQPQCTYCAGLSPSQQVDHCPPIGVFDKNDRPKGLEFGVCEECHAGTREMDSIAAVLSRANVADGDRLGLAEAMKYGGALVNNHPDIARLFAVREETIKVDGETKAVVNIDGPEGDLLHKASNGFAARFALAIYRETFSRPASLTSRVAVSWYSGKQLYEGRFPKALIDVMGEAKTISMGKKSVEGQFRYWSGGAPNFFGTFAVFRQSFAVLGIVNDIPEHPDGFGELYRPGFLKGFKLGRLPPSPRWG